MRVKQNIVKGSDHTGKPYVKKLMVKVRKTVRRSKTLVCLTPDLEN